MEQKINNKEDGRFKPKHTNNHSKGKCAKYQLKCKISIIV